MPLTGNAIENNPLAGLVQRAGPGVTNAIKQASLKTGVDFAYMMEKAAAESNFDADAKARTSSASGLYQFIESTWLQMVNRYGDKHGLGEYADQISNKGKVSSLEMRKEILALRNDPEVASLMAGEFAAENRQTLINSGVDADQVGSTELYLAHFLGAGSASQFIKAMNENPLTPAADIFPRAAKANKNVFYNSKTQEARSLAEVHAFFDKKFGNAVTPSPTQMAAIDSQSAAPRVAARPQPTMVQDNAGAIRNAMMAIDYNHDTQDIIALMSGGHGSIANGTSATTMPGSLLTDPVAIMLMARNDGPEQDNLIRR